jgi:hypothetical protein
MTTSKPEILTQLIIDVANGTETIVPLTEEEIANLEIVSAAASAKQAELEARAAARASALAKLADLGLTEAEINAL